MTLEIVSRFLLLYGAFATGAVLIFVYLIARFYQRSSGDETRYRWFLLPIFCLVTAFIHNASTNQLAGDLFSFLLFIAAGLVLLPLSLRLYRVMTHGRER
jgi:hypothetical protein